MGEMVGAGITEKKLRKRAVPTHDCCYEPAQQHLGSESHEPEACGKDF